MWEIEGTDELATWFGSLSASDQEAVDVALTMLAESGPTLGRPLVDSIKASRHLNMKELRPLATDIRVLFAFDSRRMAILLLGGNKAGQWEHWYRVNIPRADDLYGQHVATLKAEGLL